MNTTGKAQASRLFTLVLELLSKKDAKGYLPLIERQTLIEVLARLQVYFNTEEPHEKEGTGEVVQDPGAHSQGSALDGPPLR